MGTLSFEGVTQKAELFHRCTSLASTGAENRLRVSPPPHLPTPPLPAQVASASPSSVSIAQWAAPSLGPQGLQGETQ